jgi:hypothetical protein
MAKTKKRRTRTAAVPERYKPPSMKESVRGDSEMMADDIIRKHPAVVKAKKRMARQIEKAGLNIARTGVKLPSMR